MRPLGEKLAANPATWKKVQRLPKGTLLSPGQVFPLHLAKGLSCMHVLPLDVRLIGFLVG